jgi:hypothetical protein
MSDVPIHLGSASNESSGDENQNPENSPDPFELREVGDQQANAC